VGATCAHRDADTQEITQAARTAAQFSELSHKC
jgi:hypothetical protein